MLQRWHRRGLTFNHAFSNGPFVRSPRSTLALGIWGPRGGFQYHRKAELATLPEGSFAMVGNSS